MWRERTTAADAKMGPEEPRSTALTPEEEAILVAFRRRALLPLGDCLCGLQPTIAHLTRPSPHGGPSGFASMRPRFEHKGERISRLPEIGDKPRKQRFASCPTGCSHVDPAEARTGEGKPRLLKAIERTAKLAFARLVERAGKMEAAGLPRGPASRRSPVASAPCRRIGPSSRHRSEADGVQFTPRRQDIRDSQPIFGRVCEEHGIERR